MDLEQKIVKLEQRISRLEQLVESLQCEGSHTKNRNSVCMENEIRSFLDQFHPPVHLIGYQYLVAAIQEVANNPTAFHRNFSTVLYPRIAKKFNVTNRQVERNLRTVVEHIWNDCNENALRQYFGRSSSDTGKSCCSHFIHLVAEEMTCKH